MGEEGLKYARFGILGLTLFVAACASGADTTQAPLPDGYVPPAQAASRPYSPAPQPAAPADSCGASELKWLVGKPKSEIPVPTDPSTRRVICTTCPRTEEFMPRRQTITFDLDSGVVQSVNCG